MPAAYLEEEEEDVYEGGEEWLGEDMGAAQRARMLQQRRGYDEEAEVRGGRGGRVSRRGELGGAGVHGIARLIWE